MLFPCELHSVVLGLANPQQMDISVQALPITELARFTGLNAPIPGFIPISLRIGPFTISIVPKAVVDGINDDCFVGGIASITGKCSGQAPAMTAKTAILTTVHLTTSLVSMMNISLTTSSGGALVPASIFCTRSSVGRMIGRQSVQPLCWKR